MVLAAIDRVVGFIAERARALLRALTGPEPEAQPRDDLPTDSDERLQLAVREIRPQLNRQLDDGVPEDNLRGQLATWRTQYDLRELDLREGKVVAGNSPTVDVVAVLEANAGELRRLVADAADALMDHPRVRAEQQRILRAHGGEAGIASAADRVEDGVIPTVPVGPGPGFLGAAGALREADRPARFGPRSPVEFTSMPFGMGLSGEQQSARGPGGVIVGRGSEPGAGSVSVSYPALVSRYRQIAAAQNPPLSDRAMAGIVTRYVHSGVMAPPFHEGTNMMFLAEFSRVVFSVETARSQSFAVESSMILSLLRTGTLTFEEAYGRESEVNPMTMVGASAATRTEEAIVHGQGTQPGGRLGARVTEVSERRRDLLVVYALREIEQRDLTFGSQEDVMDWARDFLLGRIVEEAESLFGLGDAPPSSMMN
jgi:hypothetical protein